MPSTFIWYFLSPKGRISRQEFALGLFGLILVDMLIARIGVKFDFGPRYYNVRSSIDDGSIVHALLFLSLWPFAMILVKRLHDLGVSGWWALTILVVPHLTRGLPIKFWIPYLVIVATLSVIPGKPGDNRFGRDPLARAGI